MNNKFKLKTPIIFLTFNRPDTTQLVLESIRRVEPPQLLVVADGARKEKLGEIEKCAAVRQIIKTIDWDCEVITNYSDVNLGCKERVSSGLDWAFSIVDKAIILEDDCLPNISFFQFCEELLEEYQDDNRIMAISGNNFQFGRKRNNDSYYYSIYPHCWGWATWKRAWQHYDIQLKLWDKVKKDKWLASILSNPFELKYWHNNFQKVYDNKINTWDFQWTLACWLQSGLTILPNVNLVSNIGFASEGTHHKNANNSLANMATEEMNFPLIHPPYLIRDILSDSFTFRKVFSYSSRVHRKIKSILGI